MIDLIGVVADQLTSGYLETCEIHDALVRAGLTEEDAYLTYVGGMMVYEARKAAFEAQQAPAVDDGWIRAKPTIKLAAVRTGPPVSLTVETPLEPIRVDDRNDPPGLV